jgi:hypothetical protein
LWYNEFRKNINHNKKIRAMAYYRQNHCCLINFPRAIFVVKAHGDCMEV